MVNSFTDSIRTAGSYGLVQEFDSLHGVADIVLYKPLPNWIKRAELSDIPSKWAYFLRLLPYRKALTIHDIIEIGCMSHTQAKIAVNTFCEAGYFKVMSKNTTWMKIRQPQLVMKEIVAIEAKLTKWREALYQATRYTHFAHKSWVIIDEKSSKPALNNLTLFARYGIGLSVISDQGYAKICLKPRSIIPKSALLYWRANVELLQELRAEV